jgi:Holliday junction resolvase RusA-like endonuclease
MITLPLDITLGRTKIYTVRGDPVALARPRMGKKPYCNVYDSQKQLKLLMSITLGGQHDEEPLFEGPLYVDIIFYMRMPMMTLPRRKVLNGTFCKKRPDIDNMCKFYLDVANGIIYSDDSTIACMTLRKIYDFEPRTVMTVSEII